MRRPLDRWLAALLALGALALSSRFARADNPEAAALIEQGLDLRQAQRDAEALALFEKAQAIAPSPRGQAQVALAQQALGRWLLAEKNLRAALSAAGDPWIESRRPILERAMAVISSHLGDVEIVGARTGAVYIDGARVDDPDLAPFSSATPVARLRLEVGRRTLELRAPGWYPFSRVIDVLPDEVVRVEAEQHPLLDDRPPGAVSAPPGAAAATTVHTGQTQRTLGWIALGSAGLFVGTGIFGLAYRDVAAGNFNGSTACTETAPSQLSAQCKGWMSNGTTGQTLAIVGFVGGAALGGLSIALLVSAPGRVRGASALSLPCSAVRGGGLCGLQGAF